MIDPTQKRRAARMIAGSTGGCSPEEFSSRPRLMCEQFLQRPIPSSGEKIPAIGFGSLADLIAAL